MCPRKVARRSKPHCGKRESASESNFIRQNTRLCAMRARATIPNRPIRLFLRWCSYFAKYWEGADDTQAVIDNLADLKSEIAINNSKEVHAQRFDAYYRCGC